MSQVRPFPPEGVDAGATNVPDPGPSVTEGVQAVSDDLRAEVSREWRPGDPLYADAPERGHCLNAACGATWTPAGADTCPECGSLAGAAAVFGEPLCVLDESNDMEAFAALPECLICGGTGKQVPSGFWGAEAGGEDDGAIDRIARSLWNQFWSVAPEAGSNVLDRWRPVARAAVRALREET